MGYNEGQNLLKNQTWRLDNTICLHDTHTHTHILSLSHTYTHTNSHTQKRTHSHIYMLYSCCGQWLWTYTLMKKKIFGFFMVVKVFFMFSNMLLTHFSSFVSFFFHTGNPDWSHNLVSFWMVRIWLLEYIAWLGCPFLRCVDWWHWSLTRVEQDGVWVTGYVTRQGHIWATPRND